MWIIWIESTSTTFTAKFFYQGVDKHFSQTGHNFNLHAKFIIIEQLQDIEKISNEMLKERLKTREKFSIKKLKT